MRRSRGLAWAPLAALLSPAAESGTFDGPMGRGKFVLKDEMGRVCAVAFSSFGREVWRAKRVG